MKCHRGTALLEVMIFIASCSVVLTISTALIHRMLTLSQRMNHTATLQRLTHQVTSQLHNDIRNCTGVQITTSESRSHAWTLTLACPQETITYSVEGSKLMRVVNSAQTDLPSRNVFPFPESTFFEIRQTSPPVARIDIDICRRLDTDVIFKGEDHVQKQSAEATLVLCRITDVVGYDHRYVTSTTVENTP